MKFTVGSGYGLCYLVSRLAQPLWEAMLKIENRLIENFIVE